MNPRKFLMNNNVIFAAAGNGKTYSLCSKAKDAVTNSKKYVLLLSYTNEGVKSLENEYRKQNQGILADRVIIKTWYSFLLSDFIKPYQCLLKLKSKYFKKELPIQIPENFVDSISFYNVELPPRFYNQTHFQYFFRNHDIVPDRVSNLAYLCNEHSTGKALSRIESIFSHIFIDELQDYAGWDLEIIRLLFDSQVEITCVGDYMQATYRTNNSQKNRQYRDDKIRDFFESLEKKGKCSISYADTTRRFNSEICDFVNTIYGEKGYLIKPSSHIQLRKGIENIGVYMMDTTYLSSYCEYYHPMILRYDKRTKMFFSHNCSVFNYGASKGATFDRVVIIPVSTTIPFLEEQKMIKSNQTRAKFFVACTRAKHSVVFAVDNPKENMVFKPVNICLPDVVIPALKFTNENSSE